MARNQKKIQKKRQQKNLKRKQKLAQRQSQPKRTQAQLLAQRIVRQQSEPIHKCLISTDLLEGGIGTVLFSRKLSSGDIAMAGFIADLDIYGVKEAFYNCIPETEFENAINEQNEKSGLKSVAAGLIRKVLEGAVAHAKTLGHKPHPEYTLVKQLFDDIDPNTCTETFKFGRYQADLNNQKQERRKAIKAEVLPELKQYYRSLFSN